MSTKLSENQQRLLKGLLQENLAPTSGRSGLPTTAIANPNPGPRIGYGTWALMPNPDRAPKAETTRSPNGNLGPAGPLRSGIQDAANNIRANIEAIQNFPVGGDDFGGSGPAGGGYAPPPLVLPRMQLPAPELLAQQAFMAVDTARAPYTAALAALAASRQQGDQAITAANREATTAGRQTQQDWQRRTAGIEGNIASVYRDALSQLAGVVADNNKAMMAAGFQPADTGQTNALGRLSGLGAAARESALVRQRLGADAFRDQQQAVAGVTQAGRGALASTYAQVLGGLQAQQAAAEAAARFEQFNREMALRQQIDQINYDASVQEAMANR